MQEVVDASALFARKIAWGLAVEMDGATWDFGDLDGVRWSERSEVFE